MDKFCEILKDAKNIAVVGLSGNPLKISRTIASYLVTNGYNVAGVNPAITHAGEIPVYKSLIEIPFKIDIVNVFRRSETIPELLDDILAVKPKAVWLQADIVSQPVMDRIEEEGIIGIQDNCIMVTHRSCF
jgi:uncharacterized protein